MDAVSNTSPDPPVPSARKLLVPLLVAIPVMLTFVTIPIAPLDLDTDTDTSLSAVMDYGMQHGLHLGAELVNTYGVLGHLIFFYFAPHTAAAQMITAVALGYMTAAGLCLVAWRLRWPGRSLLLGTFMFMTANTHPRADLLIDAGSLCWGLLCCVESGRRLTISAVIFTALGVFAALAKNSFLFASGTSLVLLSFVLAARSQWRLGLGMVMGFVLGVLAGWVALGPSLADLPASALNAFSMVRAYNQAMGWDPLSLSLEAGLLVTALAIPMIVLRSIMAAGRDQKLPALRRASLSVWISALLFFDWKHGFVRGDLWHVAYFFGFVPVLALGLEILPSDSVVGLRWSRALAGGCCIICIFALQLIYFPPPSRSLATPFQAFFEHARDLLEPGQYQRRMKDAIADDRQKADLPRLRQIIGNSSVDVFGQLQDYALLNGFNYHPRPVFQSYTVCNAHLARLNEQFYLSTNAPDYLLFALDPTDRRFPTLEDPMLLRDLLFNFQLVDAEGPFLLLKPDRPAPTRPTLVREGEARAGELIDLKDQGDANLWMEIDLRLNVLGRLRQFLYRAPTIRLAAWRDGHRLFLKRRAPPIMLAAGFLASPLISRNENLADFYHGKPVGRPVAYSVEVLAGEEYLWQSDFHFRIYRIEKGTPVARR